MRTSGLQFLCVALAALMCAACGNYSSRSSAMAAGSVTITQLMPSRAIAGGSNFTLAVQGANFGQDAVLYWNNMPRFTSYVSGSQLSAAIMASDVSTPGMFSVYVRSNGQNSNMLMFTVN